MSTSSSILAGTVPGMELAFGSACHGAGRAMGRHAATRCWRRRAVQNALSERGIIVRSPSAGLGRGGSGAYRSLSEVVSAAAASGAGLARLEPLV